MERRTIVAILIMLPFIALDLIWATLNYILPLLLFGSFELIPYIFGNAIVDWLTLWYLIPILAIPFYLLMAIITPRWLVLPLNRILNPGSETYYFGIETETKRPVLTLLRRAFFALIIVLGISLPIATYFGPFFVPYPPEFPLSVNTWNAVAVITPIVFFVLGLILPSSWLIEDSNIVYHSQPGSGPQELRSASRVLMDLIAGYAGISVIIAYSLLINDISLIYLSALTFPWPWVPPVLIIVVTFLNPFIYIYMPLLVLLVYHRYFPSLQRTLVKYMKSRGTQQLSQIAIIDTDISDFLGRQEQSDEPITE